MPLRFELVTAERQVFADENVDMIIAPSVDGQVGILPHHAPLIAILEPGEVRVVKGSDEQSLVVAGGFLEVLDDMVTILADAAERSEEINLAEAEQARNRAEQTIANRGAPGSDLVAVELAMRYSMIRLRVGQSRGRRRRE
jgi:F-type H+-transporting ATPase subunit epsilon